MKLQKHATWLAVTVQYSKQLINNAFNTYYKNTGEYKNCFNLFIYFNFLCSDLKTKMYPVRQKD